MAATPDFDTTTTNQAEHQALLYLVATGGRAGPRRLLLQTHGSAQAALDAGPSAWRRAGLSERQIELLRSPAPDSMAHANDWLEHPGHHLIGWQQPGYPPLLREISSPPLALFVAGDPVLLWQPAIAVVGSRNATASGVGMAGEFARAFAMSGVVVASGMASGIDAAAHRAVLALDEARTIAVLGCGPDVAYPPMHEGLRTDIAAHGAVVTEHLPGTVPRREFFPSRNRILSGLALGTVVVEAGARSGALITARQAADAGREVFAIPGSVRNPMSRGCHRLIREGATLVESAEDVLEALATQLSTHAGVLRRTLEAPIHGARGEHLSPGSPDDPEYNRLWKALGFDPTPMDELVMRSGLTAAELSSMLLVMELDGRVVVEHGRYWRK